MTKRVIQHLYKNYLNTWDIAFCLKKQKAYIDSRIEPYFVYSIEETTCENCKCNYSMGLLQCLKK
jgi:hypothetical protein